MAFAAGRLTGQTVAPAAPAAAPDPIAPLDPSAPLAPMPDLGVAWPDLSAPEPPAAGKAAITADKQARYGFTLGGIEPVDDPELKARFAALSALAKGEGRPANAAQLDRRARDDADILRDLLRADGYYDADVVPHVDVAPAGGRINVTLAAEPGQRYTFAGVDLAGLAGTGADEAALRAAFAIKPGHTVNAEKVTAAEESFRTALGRQGFAFAGAAKIDVVVDHATHSATLALSVDPGEQKKFGHVIITGKRPFGQRHLEKMARFREGDRFDASKLEDLRRAIIATGLVSVVKLTPVQSAVPDVVDVQVALESAPPRTIAGQLGYGTGEGARAEISWQHRNLIRPEGAVTFRAVAGTQEQLLGADLRRSNFRARDEVLTALIQASHTNHRAYDARTFTVGGGIERQTNIIWQKKWIWSVGAQIIASDEKDVSPTTNLPRRRTFFIAALPATLAYDGSDDLLNPTRGYRLAGQLTPEASFHSGTFGYVKLQVDASGYLPVHGNRLVLAGRVRVGSILGAGSNEIAPSRRLYSGGGGSVRGYGYQAIGPRDVDNDPVGGSGLAEFAVEARIRFGNFGVVPFLDAGNVYAGSLPKFTGLRYGSGLGVRYYSAFGPIRIDLGTPINPQKGDSRVTVFVSLGQAF